LTAVVIGVPALGQATTNSLGLDSGLNLMSFGDLVSSNSDIQGRVAVGGMVDISSYSINTSGLSGIGLTVGGDLNFANGQIHGNTLVGGSLSTNQTGTFFGTVQVAQPSAALGINFATEKQRLHNLSVSFDALANTGTPTDNYGTMVFNANNASLAVFDLNAADAGKNLQLSGVGANTTVIINVQGTNINFGNHGYTGFTAGHVLFNFAQATRVTFASGVDASFLAPDATFIASSGVINGQVVANGWYGSTELHAGAFTGVTPVPEPQTYAMMLVGLGVVTCFSRRRRQTPSRASLSIA